MTLSHLLTIISIITGLAVLSIIHLFGSDRQSFSALVTHLQRVPAANGHQSSSQSPRSPQASRILVLVLLLSLLVSELIYAVIIVTSRSTQAGASDPALLQQTLVLFILAIGTKTLVIRHAATQSDNGGKHGLNRVIGWTWLCELLGIAGLLLFMQGHVLVG